MLFARMCITRIYIYMYMSMIILNFKFFTIGNIIFFLIKILQKCLKLCHFFKKYVYEYKPNHITLTACIVNNLLQTINNNDIFPTKYRCILVFRYTC